jgi:hypothetical protein
VEIEPGHAAETQRQILEQSLGDEAQPNVPFVSGKLAAEVLPVELGLALHILLAAATVDGIHILHPEMVGVSPDGVNGLLEADVYPSGQDKAPSRKRRGTGHLKVNSNLSLFSS